MKKSTVLLCIENIQYFDNCTFNKISSVVHYEYYCVKFKKLIRRLKRYAKK